MCVFCTMALARFAARLHPQSSKPSVTDHSPAQEPGGTAPPPAMAEPRDVDRQSEQPAGMISAHPNA
jgi:hypothetical protein